MCDTRVLCYGFEWALKCATQLGGNQCDMGGLQVCHRSLKEPVYGTLLCLRKSPGVPQELEGTSVLWHICASWVVSKLCPLKLGVSVHIGLPWVVSRCATGA